MSTLHLNPAEDTARVAEQRRDTTRRTFLAAAGGSLGTLALWSVFRRSVMVEAASDNGPAVVKVAEVDAAGNVTGVKEMQRIRKPDSAWKQQLTFAQYDVTRHTGTEMAYSGSTWNNHEAGLYRCVCCNLPLFSSKTKFDSGTGWPSFYQPVAGENVVRHMDVSLGMERTEVTCRLCDAHLGHVFDDGPRPTGLRYCMNSAAMKFVKFA